MRKTENPLQVIDRLMSENEKILFNLFYRIAESECSFWATDDKSYIIGQTNERLPLWIWIAEESDSAAHTEIETVLKERLTLNPELKVTADAKRIEDILQKVSREHKAAYTQQEPMIIYRCDKVNNPKKASGHLILSNEKHQDTLARFITGMVYDLEKRPMRENEAESFAEDVAGSADLFLWEDNGTVVSMAMIAHRTDEFARINTVYTDSDYRGKGYAGMLVGAVTQKLLDENRIPMLYTEKDNVCSNATYQRIGYNICGELTQFLF